MYKEAHTRTTLFGLALIIFLTFCSLKVPSTTTAPQNLSFIEGSLADILDKAQTDKKHVFVHTFSRYCETCQSYAKQLFANQSVVQFYNNNFINYKLDLDENKYTNFARIHELGHSPALLYYNSKGRLVRKAVNVTKPEELIETGHRVLNLRERSKSNWQNLQAMKEKYKYTYDDPEFLHDFAYLLKTFEEPYNMIVNQYIETQSLEELNSDRNRAFIYDFSDNLENNAIDYFVLDLAHFKAVVGGKQINEKIKIAIYNSISIAIKERDEELFVKTKTIVKDAHLPNSEAFLYYISSEFHEGVKDWDNFAKVTVKYFADYNITEPNLLNNAAEKFYLYLNDKSSLKQALKWAEQSISISSEYHNNLTLARVYKKMGATEKAIDAAKNAIKVAKMREDSETINISEAKRLLDRLGVSNY